MNLSDLKIGQSAVIKSVGGEGTLRQHFLDMGVIPTAEVTLEKFAPMGDPMELRVHGYELTLRLDDASKIENGLWLCADCHSLIDKKENVSIFSISVLEEWKAKSENIAKHDICMEEIENELDC